MIKNDKKRLEVRTDLALEEGERFAGDGGEISGVEIHKWKERKEDIRLTEVRIINEDGAIAMGKPQGRYITIEAPGLEERDEDYHKEVSAIVAEQIRTLLSCHQAETKPILVVGLGNAGAAPDSLGPRVLEHLQVTRHLCMEYGKEFCETYGYPVLSALTPGVMAQTGMEAFEIVQGVVREIRPGAVLVIDALAARSIHRLGVTIQLSDAGIHPGSGVGNHRHRLTEPLLGIPVLAIGIPTVVGAEAIVQDTVAAIREASLDVTDEMQELWMKRLLEAPMGPLYVTPHNIDDRIEMLSYTISEGIHEALFL